jgi:lariat debranching enzyme
MKCLSKGEERVDLMLSHDWPLGIEQHGNTQALLRKKPYFRAEVEQNCLGSPPNREMLDTVKPKWWFSAHLHVKFAATVRHTSEPPTPPTNASVLLVPSQVPDKSIGKEGNNAAQTSADVAHGNEAENKAELEKDEAISPSKTDAAEEDDETKFLALESSDRCAGADLTDQMTKFLALDKCLPRRQYLSVLHVETDVPKEEARLEYDAEWLTILRKTHHLTCTQRRRVQVPDEILEVSDSDVQWVVDQLKERSDSDGIAIPNNFHQTVPLYSDILFRGNCPPFQAMGNPQTDRLLELLELEHVLTVPFDAELSPEVISAKYRDAHLRPSAEDENEIDIDELSEEGVNDQLGQDGHPKEPASSTGVGGDDNEDDNEIDIDSLDEDSPVEALPEGCGDEVDVERGQPEKKARLDD